MMVSLLLMAAKATDVATSQSLVSHLAAGLVVSIEQIPEAVAVDGVSITVQRATGKGVPELAKRIEALWHREGSRIAKVLQDEWRISSRLQGRYIEVLQQRSGGTGPELLWSILDIGAQVQPAPSAGLMLPASCAWGRSVSGRSGTHSYVQRSARCPHSIPSLSTQLLKSLPQQGWQVRAATDSAMQVERPGSEGLISLSIQKGDSQTWLTWLLVETGR